MAAATNDTNRNDEKTDANAELDEEAMSEPLPLKRGDFARLTQGDSSIVGMVVLASGNHKSLMIMFDGMLGGWLGMVPLSWYEDRYIDMRGVTVEIGEEKHEKG